MQNEIQLFASGNKCLHHKSDGSEICTDQCIVYVMYVWILLVCDPRKGFIGAHWNLTVAHWGVAGMSLGYTGASMGRTGGASGGPMVKLMSLW